MSENRFPPGWDRARVERLLAHYEEQSEEEAVAEDQAVFADAGLTMMEVPKALVPQVRELIARHEAASAH